MLGSMFVHRMVMGYEACSVFAMKCCIQAGKRILL